MLTFLSEIAYWHWFIFGILLIAAEAVFPTALLILWPGIAALMTGVAVVFVPHLPPIYQIGIWLIVSFVFTGEWIKYCKDNPARPTVRRTTRLPGEEYIGRQFTLQKPIIYGRGEIEIDERVFPVLAIDDYPAGTVVKVARVEGSALRIQQVL